MTSLSQVLSLNPHVSRFLLEKNVYVKFSLKRFTITFNYLTVTGARQSYFTLIDLNSGKEETKSLTEAINQPDLIILTKLLRFYFLVLLAQGSDPEMFL